MLTVSHLSKHYGDNHVLKGLDFSIPEGVICGFVGKNGSGKTTFFHSLLNFVAYQGEIALENKPITKEDYPRIGYLPEERSLTPRMTIIDQVSYLASLKGMSRAAIQKKLPEWMERLEVKGKLTDKIKSLSKGNQQKVQLIITLIHEPDLIILDEPFSGLDPVNAGILKEVIRTEKRRGATIIFSDHVMTNVQELCDQLLMIQDGQLVLNGSIQDIRQSFGRTRLFVSGDLPKEELEALPHVTAVNRTSQGTWRLLLDDEKAGEILFEQISGGSYITTFDQQPPTIDEIFKLKSGVSL